MRTPQKVEENAQLKPNCAMSFPLHCKKFHITRQTDRGERRSERGNPLRSHLCTCESGHGLTDSNARRSASPASRVEKV